MGCTCEKLWRRKHSKIGHKCDSFDSPPNLTDAQKAVIRNNWQILKCHVANIGVITYVGMFESRPELLEVFSKFKGRDLDELRRAGLLRQHALRVMATIDKVITRLDEPSSLKQMLREVGEHHKVYKVPPDYLQVILPHFLNAIKPHIEDDWCDDLEDAWKTMFAIILNHMKEGYNETNHNQRHYIVEP
ncbi:cytoglobin-2-like [Ruditapes philippinarum]|uniref:cytoglobin-2-like n=1 Tax=Ruditapes philippinarum TaxID=129788 RepID=UPI00295BC0BD|nr:cytoglobin-2-like [Ruditapes philippinarum]